MHTYEKLCSDLHNSIQLLYKQGSICWNREFLYEMKKYSSLLSNHWLSGALPSTFLKLHWYFKSMPLFVMIGKISGLPITRWHFLSPKKIQPCMSSDQITHLGVSVTLFYTCYLLTLYLNLTVSHFLYVSWIRLLDLNKMIDSKCMPRVWGINMVNQWVITIIDTMAMQ